MSRRPALCLALLLPLALVACSSETSPPIAEFAPLQYDYLTPLRLNVASIETDDRYVPAPGGPASMSPVSPVQALEQMAHDRLRADGNSGKAVFVIEDASIIPVAGGLSGSMAVRLDVLTGDGHRGGYAEARVSQIYAGPDPEQPAVVYRLIRQMMDRMNVEFEYQVKRTLRDWLQQTGTAPPPAPVEQQSLGTPGSPMPLAPTAPSEPSAPLPLAPPAPTTAPPSSVPPSLGPSEGVLGTLPVNPPPPSGPLPLAPAY